MKKTILYSFGVILLIVIIYIAYQLYRATQYTVRLKAFAIKKIKGSNISGWIMVYIYNPSNLSVYIESYDGLIYIDGVKFTDISGKPNLLINPKKEFVLKMDYKINPKEVLTLANIATIFEEPSTIITAKGKITIKAGSKSITLPFSYSDSLQNILTD